MNGHPQPPEWSVVAHGDRCLVIRFGTGIAVPVGRRCASAAAALRRAALPGVSDIVPTFNTVAIHYLPGRLAAGVGVAELQADIERVLQASPPAPASTEGRLIELPVCYGGEFGPDLPEVAERTGLSPDEVIALHGRDPGYVFMLGFAPGAPFVGVLDERFALPRRDTPRTAIPAGSVGVANRQTFIYPDTLPGGWHIIGRTPLRLFDPARTPATVVQPGDNVRFRPMTPKEFMEWPK